MIPESGYGACVDFLSFTVAGVHVRTIFDRLATHLSPMVVQPRDRGVNGFEHSAELVGLGLVAWGGSSVGDRVWVSLSGAGCAAVRDFPALQRQLEQWSAKLTRVDVAFDDYAGQSVDIDRARAWYESGAFNIQRRPNATLIDDLGNATGRTFYVGSRGAGKLCRIYEKGKALGAKASAWVRAEVEIRDRDRVIPYDVLTRPADYVAGSYPALAFVSGVATKIRTCKAVAARTLTQICAVARSQVGRLLGTLNSIGVEPRDVVDALSRVGTPRRLEGWDRHVRGSLAEVKACLSQCRSLVPG